MDEGHEPVDISVEDSIDGIDVALEAVTKAYDVIREQVKATQDRCGIAVGVSAAGITAIASRFVALLPFFIEQKQTANVLAAGFLGFWFFVVGTIFFIYGFLHDNQWFPLDRSSIEELVNSDKVTVQLQRVAWLEAILVDLVDVGELKKHCLVMGIVFLGISVLIFGCIEGSVFLLDPKGVPSG